MPAVEGQGISAVSMRSGQLSIRRIRELGPAVTKGKSLTKADLDSCERISIGNAYVAHDGLRLRIIADARFEI